MNHKIVINIGMNMTLMVVFVWLNNWALSRMLEETFVVLAMGYGLISVLLNAVYLAWANKK